MTWQGRIEGKGVGEDPDTVGSKMEGLVPLGVWGTAIRQTLK